MSLTVESLKELWAKEFLPNIRKEIRKEIDSLKASLLDLKKRFDEIEKSQNFIFYCDIDDQGLKRTQRRCEKPN